MDPQLNSPLEASTAFIGDYFGNIIDPATTGNLDIVTSVITYNQATTPTTGTSDSRDSARSLIPHRNGIEVCQIPLPCVAT